MFHKLIQLIVAGQVKTNNMFRKLIQLIVVGQVKTNKMFCKRYGK